MLFADIFRQIVEFHRTIIIVFDEFVVSLADGPAETIAAVEGVIGVMEVDGLAPEWAFPAD